MLRVNVGLSRKLTQDFNSTGFSVSLDGEVALSTDDPEAMLTRISELYGLAEAALQEQIERHQEGHDGHTVRVEQRQSRPDSDRRATNGTSSQTEKPAGRHRTEKLSGRTPERSRPRGGNGRQSQSRNGSGGGKPDEPATNKEVQFLLTLSRRFGMGMPQLESRVEGVIGRRCGVYDLTKREAGQILDELTAEKEQAS